MDSTGNQCFLSSKELMLYRKNTSKSLPIRPPKDSNLSDHDVQILYDEQEQILSEERVEKIGSVCVAEYSEETKRIELQKNLGKMWHKMGYSENGKKYLHPEEALFLLESIRLEVYRNKLPLSVQEGYALFLDENCTLEQYQVYSHLSRLGYVVVRYNEKCDQASTSQDRGNGKIANTSSKIRKEISEIDVDKEDDCSSANGSSDDQDGLYIVYESLQRKRMKLQDDKSANETETSSILCNVNNGKQDDENNLFYEFPNIGGKSTGTIHLPIPPENLLPPNVNLTNSMCEVDIEKMKLINTKVVSRRDKHYHNSRDNWRQQESYHHRPASHHKFRPRNSYSHYSNSRARCYNPTDFMENNSRQNDFEDFNYSLANVCRENGIKNWKEYKQMLTTTRDKEYLLQSPAAHLWTSLHKPVLQPKDGVSSEAVRERLRCVKSLSDLSEVLLPSSKPIATKYKIKFNVYLPQTNYKKSSPPIPNHRVIVIKSTDSVPSLEDVAALRALTGDNIPLHFAVVENGSISIYSFNDIFLPDLK